MSENNNSVLIEVDRLLCDRIINSLQDSIERLDQKGTNSIQNCLDDLLQVVNPITVGSIHDFNND